jgi:hypothetical protein
MRVNESVGKVTFCAEILQDGIDVDVCSLMSR